VNNQAKNWVWDYEKNVTIICKTFFRQDSAAAEDVAHDVLVKLSQKDGLDQVRNRSAWISESARNECLDYFRKLNRQSGWRDGPFEHLRVEPDEKLSDEKLDKEARKNAKDLENETDRPDPKVEPEKIDPLNCYRSLVSHEPKKAVALDRSFYFVTSAFGQIRGMRHYYMEYERIRNVLAALRDVKRRSEKILGIKPPLMKDNFAQKAMSMTAFLSKDRWREYFGFHSNIYAGHFNQQPLSFFIQQQIRELIRRTEKGLGDFEPDLIIALNDPRFANRLNPYFIRYYSQRPLDLTLLVPDPLYVLYRIWNRILRKGREGKYGDRKMLEMLLLAYKKMTAGNKYIDTLNSLTEETNFETLRTMSYRLNKGYSEFADFIFEMSIHPPSRAQFKKIRRLWHQYLDAQRTWTRLAEKEPATFQIQFPGKTCIK